MQGMLSNAEKAKRDKALYRKAKSPDLSKMKFLVVMESDRSVHYFKTAKKRNAFTAKLEPNIKFKKINR